MDRPKCLLVLTALRFTEEYGEAALMSARDRGEDLVLCLVIDRELSESVSEQLVDTGFLGERLGDQLRSAMLAEYRERGLGHLNELVQAAADAGLRADSRVVDGPFVSSILEVAEETGAQRIIVARQQRPHLSRIVFGSGVDELVRRAPCTVDVYHDAGAGAVLSGSNDDDPPASS